MISLGKFKIDNIPRNYLISSSNIHARYEFILDKVCDFMKIPPDKIYKCPDIHYVSLPKIESNGKIFKCATNDELILKSYGILDKDELKRIGNEITINQIREVISFTQISAHKNKKIAYVDVGTGDPIIFFHGNPSSSYLYRNIIKNLNSGYRCIAADMIGMGDSDKLDNPGHMTYTFDTHFEYLSELIKSLNLNEKITLVGQDWGGPLSIKWARENSDKVRGICYFETVIAPIKSEEMQEPLKSLFMMLRSEKGDKKVLEENFFVEKMLGTDPITPLSEETMAVYRKPFLNPGEDRRPTLDWPRQIPIDKEPKHVHEEVKKNLSFMMETEIPKLLIIAEPGRLMPKPLIEFCRKFKNQSEATVKGNHFVQEDSPDEISENIDNWLKSI